ncbi:heterogeneous ribonuclear particle protein [Aphelenchoides avenae]|nr:heterogeneous ribonuclear particle protein [Aphelenchus avenae]
MGDPECVYVSGIREGHTEKSLKEYFQQFGYVYQVNIIKHFEGENAGKPRGFAFIKFTDADSANKCLRQKFHVVQGQTCVVSKARSKSRIEQRAEEIFELLDARLARPTVPH